MKTIQGMRGFGLSDDEIEDEIHDIFAENDKQLSVVKQECATMRLDNESLRGRLRDAYTQLDAARNPNAVNCDGLHADGSAPNTPHRPIGIIRDHPCPACDALRENDRLRALIVEFLDAWRDTANLDGDEAARLGHAMDALAEAAKENKS